MFRRAYVPRLKTIHITTIQQPNTRWKKDSRARSCAYRPFFRLRDSRYMNISRTRVNNKRVSYIHTNKYARYPSNVICRVLSRLCETLFSPRIRIRFRTRMGVLAPHAMIMMIDHTVSALTASDCRLTTNAKATSALARSMYLTLTINYT